MKSQNDQFTQSSYAKGGPELRKVSYCLDNFLFVFFSSFLCILLFLGLFCTFSTFLDFFAFFSNFFTLFRLCQSEITTFLPLFRSFFLFLQFFHLFLSIYITHISLSVTETLSESLSLRLYLHNFLKEKTVLHCLDKLRNCCCNWFFLYRNVQQFSVLFHISSFTCLFLYFSFL